MAEIPLPDDITTLVRDLERRVRMLETRPFLPGSQYVDNYERCTSTTYAPLGTAGPSVTVNVGQSKLVIVTTSAYIQAPSNTSATIGLFIDGVLVSDTLTLGNSTSATITLNETNTRTISVDPGSHTFELRYKQSLTEAWFSARQLIVQPF